MSSERGMWREAQGMGGVGQQASIEVTSWSAAWLPPHSVAPAPELGRARWMSCSACRIDMGADVRDASRPPPSLLHSPPTPFPPPPRCSHLPMCSQFHQLPCPSLFLSSHSLFFPLYPKGYYTFKISQFLSLCLTAQWP